MLALIVRHGPTARNNPSNRTLRGWMDDPLTVEAVADVIATAKRLRPYEPKSVVSSDFMRDLSTAQILANQLGIASSEVDYDARTWDVGSFSGQPEEEVNPAILALYRRPWDTPPGSTESFNDFSARWTNFLDRKMCAATIDTMRPIIIVTHGRCIALTDCYYNFKLPEEGLMPPPAGFGVLSVGVDRSLAFDFAEETEPVLSDV